jgi:uncharacterized protein YraI
MTMKGTQLNHIDTVTTFGLDAMSGSVSQRGTTPGKHSTMSSVFDTFTRDAAASTAMGRPMNRRHLMKLIGIGTAAVVVGVAGAAEQAGAQSYSQYKTTTSLNLRSGPGTNYPVIRVMQAGATVTYAGVSQNGFYKVGYGDAYGWAHKDYLAAVGGGTGSDPVMVGTAATTSAVNLRSGPSTSHQVLRVVAAGAPVQISSTVQSGFRYVIHNGLAGWIADQYLSSGTSDDQGGNYRTTTTALNLRSEPSTSAKVLTVMPAGAKVQMLHTGVGSFANVNYNGMQGWAHLDYLK